MTAPVLVTVDFEAEEEVTLANKLPDNVNDSEVPGAAAFLAKQARRFKQGPEFLGGGDEVFRSQETPTAAAEVAREE